jgi:hypothetical protein
MACLTRDFMIMQSAPKASISMLSGVASHEEVQQLAQRFTAAELVRMLNLIQQTAAGFIRSSSRRLDTELCIMSLCQPELQLDPQSMNARLSKLEDQIKSGAFTVQQLAAQSQDQPKSEPQEASPVIPLKPEIPITQIKDEAPAGFWVEICSQVRLELKPPVSGFFAPNGPMQGILYQNVLILLCANDFAKTVVDKPDVLELVSRKASAKLGRPIRAIATDQQGIQNGQMEHLLQFGRDHSDVVNIKEE